MNCRLVAYALEALGLEKGSSIAIDMPMNVTSVVVYLAIILAGYVVVSIADSFAAREISTRLKISNAKVIFTQVSSIFPSATTLNVFILSFMVFKYYPVLFNQETESVCCIVQNCPLSFPVRHITG